MSLSVLVRASRISGSRASSRKYADLMRAISTRAARCRSVKSASASGSSQGSQPSSFCVKAVGSLLSGCVITASGIFSSFLGCAGAHGCGGERAQAGNGANLEGQERNELRQRDDIVGRPAGIEERLQRGGTGVTRPEHQEMRMLECRSEPCAEAAATV